MWERGVRQFRRRRGDSKSRSLGNVRGELGNVRGTLGSGKGKLGLTSRRSLQSGAADVGEGGAVVPASEG